MKVFKYIVLPVVAAAVVWFGAPYAADYLQPDTSAQAPTEAPADEPAGADEPSDAEGEAPSEPEDVPASGSPEEAPSSDEPAEEAPEAEEPRDEETAPAFSDEAKAAILFVNKEHPLDAKYKPDDLVVPDVKFSFDGDNPKKQLQRVAAEALERLFAQAEEDGIELRAVSGYRSYATQKAIFERNASIKGEEEANRTSAYPGQSEHQTGLAMDVSAASVNYALEEVFGETVEGIWLAENAASHGFIIRYPKDKEDVTGYKYEPWHLRYVGVDIAEFVTEQGLTLEEFLEE
ncbi:M15 family metallopeptidase [Paenibacillus sp.]|uniref:M15 family metallopeptidase n=1 Tax=Paenibacillus sp. TaxID=58172 RepID=UPI002810ADE3|nr:M15 family metallopeptidase [Paenibacillus sp.]